MSTYRAWKHVNYEMEGTTLCKTVKEKYLGVSMHANMKVSEQCRIVASRVTRSQAYK